jgi:3-methyladenine DNA glycosylase AlkC
MADPPLLKDLVDRDSIAGIGEAIAGVTSGFDTAAFLGDVFDDSWEERALKQRIRHVAVCIHDGLDGEYAQKLAVLRRATADLPVTGIPVWCFNDFVEEYGVEYPDLSLPALEQFTRLASSEFAVRPFIDRYPERMAAQMLAWAESDDAAVRRLASEGFRPRLPWGIGLPAIKGDPTPVLAVLDRLRNDPDEVVRRSVANNLNDISKDHPDVTVAALRRWGDTTPASVRKHALRTLLKQGHRDAMELLGFVKNADVVVADIDVSPPIGKMGGSVHVEFRVQSRSDAPQPVMVDYAVVFQNVSGSGSRKVFKGVTAELGSGDEISLRRKISLQQMSTRRILPGKHVVEAQVNGVVLATVDFDVVEQPARLRLRSHCGYRLRSHPGGFPPPIGSSPIRDTKETG